MTSLDGDARQRVLRALIVVAATLFYLWRPTKDDISWLLVVADALLSGKRLYVDIIETNPPMSVLLYVPAILFERATSVRAETFIVFQTVAFCLMCSEIATRLIEKAKLEVSTQAFRTAAIVVMFVLPMGAFSQKDHFAFAASLPLLVMFASADRQLFTRADHLLAGLLAGLSMIIKPQFALAFALPGLAMAIKRRRLSELFTPAVLFASIVVTGYAVAVCAFFPSFVSQTLPILNDLYRPHHMGRLSLLMPYRGGGYCLIVLLVTALPLRGKIFAPFPLVLFLGSVGFLIAFLEQAKGWPYHIYPAIAAGMLLGLAITLPTLRGESGGASRVVFFVWLGCMPLVFVGTIKVLLLTWTDYSPVSNAIRELGLKRPTIVSIATSHGDGHPVTRDAGGKWVGTLSSRWITVSALTLKNLGFSSVGRSRSFDDWISVDRAYLRHDILQNHPDIILVQRGDDFDWLAWARQDPPVAEAFASYHLARSVSDPEEPGTLEIWLRSQNGS